MERRLGLELIPTRPRTSVCPSSSPPRGNLKSQSAGCTPPSTAGHVSGRSLAPLVPLSAQVCLCSLLICDRLLQLGPRLRALSPHLPALEGALRGQAGPPASEGGRGEATAPALSSSHAWAAPLPTSLLLWCLPLRRPRLGIWRAWLPLRRLSACVPLGAPCGPGTRDPGAEDGSETTPPQSALMRCRTALLFFGSRFSLGIQLYNMP